MSYSNGNNLNDEESQLKKLFIGGLNIETTDESLKAFYSKWGELTDCVVMKDANTGRSKCYGFITFSDAEALDKCMLERPHVIDGKQVDPKRAMPRKEAKNLDMHQPVKKVFIGGLRDLVENEIREYFSKFGNVVAFDMVTDKATGKNRGFCFLTYDDTDSVDKIVLLKYHTLRDIRVEVKKAVERDTRRGVGGPVPGRGGMGPVRQGMRSNNGPIPHPGNYGGHYDMPDMQQGYSQWNMNVPQMWNQSYQGVESSAGYSLGAGYGGNNVGGAMRGNRHTQRAAGPYKHSNANASYGGAPYGNTNATAPYANTGPRGITPYQYDSNAVGPGYAQS